MKFFCSEKSLLAAHGGMANSFRQYYGIIAEGKGEATALSQRTVCIIGWLLLCFSFQISLSTSLSYESAAQQSMTMVLWGLWASHKIKWPLVESFMICPLLPTLPARTESPWSCSPRGTIPTHHVPKQTVLGISRRKMDESSKFSCFGLFLCSDICSTDISSSTISMVFYGWQSPLLYFNSFSLTTAL